MVQDKTKLVRFILTILSSFVVQLFRRMGFTRHKMAGPPKKERTTSKTSITISGEYRKEEK